MKLLENVSHTMQAAIALSPGNKAIAENQEGYAIVIQSLTAEWVRDGLDHYYLWVLPPSEIPIWAGQIEEDEIDDLKEKYGVDPAARIWAIVGYVDKIAFQIT